MRTSWCSLMCAIVQVFIACVLCGMLKKQAYLGSMHEAATLRCVCWQPASGDMLRQ